MEQMEKKAELVDPPKNRTTGVLVLLTAKPGVTREQVMKFMPAEVRATVRLYLEGEFSNGLPVPMVKGPFLFSIAIMLPKRKP